jgi:uncharacterized protein (DUF1501 family)
MAITRRQFIRRGAGMVSLGLIVPRFWLGRASAGELQTASGRKFVIIQLAGGNDGLNTVVPYTDSSYRALRPMLGLKDTDLQAPQGSTIISSKFGLHPAMSEIKGLYDQGKVAIVLGTGYANPTLSHFLSMDIWHTADLSGLNSRGWLGKYADLALIGQPSLSAASIGSLDLPKTFNATEFVVPNIINFSLYNFITDPSYPGDYNNQLNAFNASASRSLAPGTFLSSINGLAFESVRGAQEVQRLITGYQSSIHYPSENPLAVALQMVAQLLTTVPEASILYVQMGGFDNHSDQIAHRNGSPDKLSGSHAVLLHWFSEAVKLFYDDMVEHNLADNLLIMQWSEFGRRPGENASFGTDHGTAAPLFVIGNPVHGGLYGEQPSLATTALDGAGNPAYKVDFREIYSTVLDRWLGVDSRTVLGDQYPNVGFLG